VLHRGTTGTFRHVPVLEEFLVARPDVGVVVTSEWRVSESLEDLRKVLTTPFAHRMLDTTPQGPSNARGPKRQAEIEQWLQQHPGVKRFCALDDTADLFQPGCHWLVLTDRRTGLCREDLFDNADRLLR
jgi:hypothetical protein